MDVSDAAAGLIEMMHVDVEHVPGAPTARTAGVERGSAARN